MERCERAEQVCGSGRWGGEGQAGRETFTDFIFVVFVFFFFYVLLVMMDLLLCP